MEDQLFGERGFRAGLDEYGQGILRELAPLAMGPVLGRAIQVLPSIHGWHHGPVPSGPAERSSHATAVMEIAQVKFS